MIYVLSILVCFNYLSRIKIIDNQNKNLEQGIFFYFLPLQLTRSSSIYPKLKLANDILIK